MKPQGDGRVRCSAWLGGTVENTVKRLFEHRDDNGMDEQNCRKRHNSKSRSGKIVMMKTEMFKCSGCGRAEKREWGKRHWCECNPRAPFPMYSVKQSRLTDALVRGFMGGMRRCVVPPNDPSSATRPTGGDA